MTKKEIISLLEYQKNMINAHYLDKPGYHSSSERREDILDYNLPNIEEINTDLNIINQELTKIKEKKQQAINYLRENEPIISQIICTHPVAFKQDSFLGSDCHCILCNQKVSLKSNNVIIPEYYYDEEDFIRYYSFNEVYEIIIDILKTKNDEDEIDLNKEFIEQFNQGNIGEITVNQTKYSKKYNVLIVYGSNIIPIDDTYLTKEIDKEIAQKVFNFYNHYTARFNVKLLTSYIKEDMKNYNIVKFTTIEDLYQKITTDKTNYDIIIDMSNLFTYTINNNKIAINDYCLPLKDIFPNSYIIKMKNNINKILADTVSKGNFSKDLKKLVLKKCYE